MTLDGLSHMLLSWWAVVCGWKRRDEVLLMLNVVFGQAALYALRKPFEKSFVYSPVHPGVVVMDFSSWSGSIAVPRVGECFLAASE